VTHADLPSDFSAFSDFADLSAATDCAEPATVLARLGWDEFFAAAYAAEAGGDPALRPGRIARVDRGRCDALTAYGTVRAATAAPASGDPTELVCTGDWAVLGRDGSGDWAVRALLPRRTAFLRSGSSKSSRGQVLAANVDLAVIAVSLAEDLVLGRLERFVSLAWAGGAQPVVVLTKADAADDAGHLRADAEAAVPGAEVLAVSAHTGAGVAGLAALLSGSTAVLLGVSGAGKSTLANVLTGSAGQAVQAVRDRDGRGRHTTTTRDLLPLPGGGVLIDTPGLRGVGLWDAADGVAQTFSDIEDLAAECRFADCGHEGEPGCAVLAAIDNGALPPRRLDSYRKLLRENTRLAARTDARLRAEQRKLWKGRSAVGQHQAQLKYGPRGKPPRSTGW
jgi:ribosome biogenesis GTPase